MNSESLTVVVTNFKRPKFLARCLKSVVDAGVKRIVCSSMSPTTAVMDILEEYSKIPGIDFHSTVLQSDLGCNELWLRGLYQVETPYVLILHDDDFLDPKFGTFFDTIIQSQLDAGVGFASWRGAVVDEEGNKTPVRYFEGGTQIASSFAISRIASKKGSSVLSPVISVFRRDTAIATLKECRSFVEPVSFTRPGMLLGNDALLYLRHAERYASWLYVDEELTYFGAHANSETIFNQTANTEHLLISGYDWAREWFRQNRAASIKLPPQLLHVWQDYESADPEERARNSEASRTWSKHYELGDLIPLIVTEKDLPRSSENIGDPKPVPYARDLFDYGCAMAREEDIVFITNRDTCFSVNLPDQLLKKFETGCDAAFAWRRTFVPNRGQDYKTFIGGLKDGGVDLIAVRPGWWNRHRGAMPDMLIGREAWDWVLRVLIAESQPGVEVEMDNIIYHEPHQSFWAGSDVRAKNPSQRHNLLLARTFFFTRGRMENGYFDKLRV